LPESTEIAVIIKRKAFELVFSACGFNPAGSLAELEPPFTSWISSGKAGEMNYLNRNAGIRLDPRKLVDGAKTIISLAASYYYPLPQHAAGNPRISRYALAMDYHQVLKARGRELLIWLQEVTGPVNGRVFTDSAPVFEREWARRAGVGWIGKNGCLIIPRKGSWFFLAEIIIDREIPSSNKTVPDRCGNCTRCADACPTGALAGDGSMDPRKCISYLTIEHKSDIPDEFKGKWNDWIFGCDICQDVCPWNNHPEKSSIPEFQPKTGLTAIDTDLLIRQDALALTQLFDGTPVARAGCSGILRNFAFLEKDESR
jgi:epoxyqueuosine reductase